MKTLVIDDDVLTRMVISKALEELGCATIQSSNGRHAWETLWENQDIKLVITDMAMPDMDGRELLQLIRGNSAFAHLPVLVISGVIDPKSISHLLSLGPCRFCPKPVQIEEIKDFVRTLAESDHDD